MKSHQLRGACSGTCLWRHSSTKVSCMRLVTSELEPSRRRTSFVDEMSCRKIQREFHGLDAQALSNDHLKCPTCWNHLKPEWTRKGEANWLTPLSSSHLQTQYAANQGICSGLKHIRSKPAVLYTRITRILKAETTQPTYVDSVRNKKVTTALTLRSPALPVVVVQWGPSSEKLKTWKPS